MLGLSVEEREQTLAEARERFRRADDAEKHLFESIHAEEVFYKKSANEYGQLGIRSIMLLNGGALFALPAYMAASNASAELVSGIFLGAFYFLISLIFGGLACLLIYVNFQWNATSSYADRQRKYTTERMWAYAEIDGKADRYKESIEYWQNMYDRYQRRVEVSYYVSIGVCIVMLFLFVAGCLICGWHFMQSLV